MDRRKFLALASSAIAARESLSAFAAEPLSKDSAEAVTSGGHDENRKPNVILFICDDLGYGDLGCYGSNISTPNVDALAKAGMRLVHCNAAHPVCSASRAALLTGRYALRSGTPGAFRAFFNGGTSLDETLLAQLFRSSGYKTAAIGKWHLGKASPYLPTDRGFDSYFGVPYSNDMYPLPLLRNTSILEADTDRDLLTPRYTEEAVSFIQEKKDTPYFLYLAYSYPHDPPRSSPKFRGKTRFGDHGDSIAEIDWSVGEILKAVHDRRQTENTIVIFTSDHGPWYQGSAASLRGRKASTFEGGLRVPFIASWPSVIRADATSAAWCSNLDVLPTLASLCGLALPHKTLDGIDISSVLRGHGESPPRKPVLYFSPMGTLGYGGYDVHCIRKGEWKLRVAQASNGEIYLNDSTTGASQSAWLERPELYNLEADPGESYDIANLHPELVAELMRSLDDQMASFPAEVVSAYESLKHQRGDISTPPGATPRPFRKPANKGTWEPPDRRWPDTPWPPD
jgi:arylsulfatase A